MVSSESIFIEDDPPPRPTKPRIVRVAVWFLVLAAAGAVSLEKYAAYCRDVSEERLLALCKSREPGPRLTGDEIQRAVVGWPLTRQTSDPLGSNLFLTWPSVYRKYRVHVRLNGDLQVTKIAISSVQDDDPTKTIALEQDGKLVTQQIEAPRAPAATGQALAEQARKAFDAPRTTFGPAALVFPIVDETNRIRPDGTGLSTIASYSAAFFPAQKLAFDPAQTRRVLMHADCWWAGIELDQKRIAVCTGAAGISTYVLPKLEAIGDRLRLSVECHGAGAASGQQTIEHDLARDDYPKLAGLIALDLLEFVGSTLSDDVRDRVAKPQIDSEAEAIELSARISEAQFRGREPSGLRPLLQRNPGCIAAWDVLYEFGRDRPGMELPRPDQALVGDCGSFSRHLAMHLNASEAIEKLLELAPAQRGNVDWHSALVERALQLKDDELLATLFTKWEQDAPDYPNRVTRGRQLLAWGWLARGSGWASTVDARHARIFHERLERSQQTLEQALVLNPLGWEAHRELIQAAVGLGLTPAYVQQHFSAATRIAPADLRIYTLKFMYLKKKWHGTVPQLMTFARECLDSGQWSAGVPQLLPEILFEADHDYEHQATSFRNFRNPAHWKLVRDYYHGAMSQNDEGVQRHALNYFAAQAAVSGNFADAAPVFERLDSDRVLSTLAEPPAASATAVIEYDVKFHGSDCRYAQLRDIVRAQTSRTPSGLLSAIRVALADARLDDAERLISEVDAASDEKAELDRCRRAVALGRRLLRERHVELTPRDVFDVFVEFTRTACEGLDRSKRWSIDGDRVIWSYPGYHAEGGRIMSNEILFPVGIRHAVVTGTVEYAGGTSQVDIISHAQALRNQVVLEYRTSQAKIVMTRLGAPIKSEQLGSPTWNFSLEYGAKSDLLSPVPGCHWKAIVYDDVPSTFGFRFAFGGGVPTVSISNLKIELRD